MLLKDFNGYIKLSEVTDQELLADIQRALSVTADGIYGPQTQTAFAAFKTKNHLGEPLMLGPSTAQALLKASPQIVTMGQAKAIFGRSPTQAQLDDLNSCLKRFDITTPARIRHFMSQIAHESGGLKWLLELSSGSQYEGRRDLGNIYTGDGPKFKGAGVIQLTGRSNYKRLAEIVDDPQVLIQGAQYVARRYPFTSAGVWWTANKMNQLIDAGASVRAVSKRVNGGFKGLADRERYFAKAVRYIA